MLDLNFLEISGALGILTIIIKICLHWMNMIHINQDHLNKKIIIKCNSIYPLRDLEIFKCDKKLKKRELIYKQWLFSKDDEYQYDISYNKKNIFSNNNYIIVVRWIRCRWFKKPRFQTTIDDIVEFTKLNQDGKEKKEKQLKKQSKKAFDKEYRKSNIFLTLLHKIKDKIIYREIKFQIISHI